MIIGKYSTNKIEKQDWNSTMLKPVQATLEKWFTTAKTQTVPHLIDGMIAGLDKIVDNLVDKLLGKNYLCLELSRADTLLPENPSFQACIVDVEAYRRQTKSSLRRMCKDIQPPLEKDIRRVKRKPSSERTQLIANTDSSLKRPARVSMAPFSFQL
jgi:hypothetical protein